MLGSGGRFHSIVCIVEFAGLLWMAFIDGPDARMGMSI